MQTAALPLLGRQATEQRQRFLAPPAERGQRLELLMGYFRSVPKEVEECALVDGASRIQTLLRIALPMAIPGIVCCALFGFTLTWNEFIYALTFVSQSSNKTAIVGVTADLIRGDIYYWGSLMAGAVLASVPVVFCYVFFLDYYVSGLTAGAVKG
jgi:multiple sugar transport system permease protein